MLKELQYLWVGWRLFSPLGACERNRSRRTCQIAQSSNDNDSINPNIGDSLAFSYSLRPLFAPAPATNTRKAIDNINDFHLGQDQEKHAVVVSQSVNKAFGNPLKREAVAESEPPDLFPETAGHRIASNQGTNALSRFSSWVKTETGTFVVNYTPFRGEPYPTQSS